MVLWTFYLGLIALYCFAEMFIRSTDDFSTAIAWFRLTLLAGGFVPPILLHFSLEFPRRHRILNKKYHRYIFYLLLYPFNIIMIIRAWVNSIDVTPTPPPETIWGSMYARDYLTNAVAPDVYQPHYVVLTIMILTAIVFIVAKLREASSKMERKQLTFLFLSLAVVFFPGIAFDMVISYFFRVYTELFTFFLSLMGVMIAYAIVRYDFLIILPETEDITLGPDKVVGIETGYAYVFPKGARDQGRKMFVSALAEKREGLVITTRDPKDIKAEFKIKRTPIIYVGKRTSYEFNIEPGNLDGLVSSLSSFLGITTKPVLMIDIDIGSLKNGLKKRRLAVRKREKVDRYSMEDWMKEEKLIDLLEQASKMLSSEMSIIVFSHEEGDKMIRTQRPFQHVSMANFFILEEILGKTFDTVERVGENPSMVLKDLSDLDPFFGEVEHVNGVLMVPRGYLLKLDRSSTIKRLRTLNLYLARSEMKGADKARDEMLKVLHEIGYSDIELNMPEGAVQFLEVEDTGQAYEMARELVASGLDGLCISTRPAKKIRHLYGLKGVEYRWITTGPTKDKDAIPASLEHIRRDIRKYLAEHEECFILLDGMELLISRLGFDDVQRFLHVIKDELATTEARMLIPVHPKALDVQKVALLKREIEA